MTVVVHPLTPERRQDWLDFFAGAGEFNWCWCRYWDFVGDSRAWIRREASANREEAQQALAASAIAIDGVLAYEGDAVVGWTRLHRRTPGDKMSEFFGPPADGTFSIGCVAVHQDARRRGAAHALLQGAIAHARALGGTTLEGYPRKVEPEDLTGPGADRLPGDEGEQVAAKDAADPTRLPDGEVWTGPTALFERAGFTLADEGEERRFIARLTL
jgi:GNAT superfamily N-acetyltransferase